MSIHNRSIQSPNDFHVLSSQTRCNRLDPPKTQDRTLFQTPSTLSLSLSAAPDGTLRALGDDPQRGSALAQGLEPRPQHRRSRLQLHLTERSNRCFLRATVEMKSVGSENTLRNCFRFSVVLESVGSCVYVYSCKEARELKETFK